MTKSKNQRIAAWVLLGAGVVSIAAVSSGNSDFGTTGTFAVLGGVAILSSIPLFIAAGRNKRRGMALSAFLDIQRMPNSQFTFNNAGYYPALSVKLKW